jgi:DNA-binding transcriptional ArsR family regulator
MAQVDSKTVLGWLKAAGEDTRLRLLTLCARQELSVSDLAEVLRQSEPRVSRHLKILCDAGLVERLRQGQWVHYRLTQSPAAASFVQGLLGQVDRADPVFVRDRQRALARPTGAEGTAVGPDGGVGGLGGGAGVGSGGAVGAGSGGGPGVRSGSAVGAGSDGGVGMRSASAVGAGSSGRTGTSGLMAARTLESRLGRALKGFVEAIDVAVVDAGGGGGLAGTSGGEVAKTSALVVGVEHLELLETAASVAGECVAIAHSRRAAQSARAFAERRGFACRVLLAAGSSALCEKDIEAAGSPFDVVFLDHLAVPDSALDGMLAYGRRALAPGGRLWLFERYDSLEIPRDKVVEHPIGRLRRLLGDVGLTCERLSPIEADGEHVLAAVAVPFRATLRGTGTGGAA